MRIVMTREQSEKKPVGKMEKTDKSKKTVEIVKSIKLTGKKESIDVKKDVYLIIAGLVFLAGIVLGCYLVSKMGDIHEGNLKSYINEFGTKIKFSDVNIKETYIYNLMENLKYVLIIWLIGFNKYLILGTIVIDVYKGFIDGFATYFLINEFGMEGLKLAILPLIAYKLIYIYLIIYISSKSLQFALNQDKEISLKNKKFTSYVLSIFICIFTILIMSFIETVSIPYILEMLK